MKKSVGIIVIGRNEGEHLRHSIGLLPQSLDGVVIYVDSGSSDDSVVTARAMGAVVHELDPTRPFSAARARDEGFTLLRKMDRDVPLVQFVDGDCILDPNWIPTAIAEFEKEDRLGIVCGKLEESGQGSIYNRMNATRWRTATVGEISASGGIFMVRTSVYCDSGGFNSQLITGEEAELCSRIRKAGYYIRRVDALMARHDSGLVSFRDWWNRAVWGGYGDALQFDVVGDGISRAILKESRSIYVLVILLPALIVAGIIACAWWRAMIVVPVTCVAFYAILLFKVTLNQRRQGSSWDDALLYASLCLVRKLPYAIGFLRYRFSRGFRSKPDPHGAKPSAHATTREVAPEGRTP